MTEWEVDQLPMVDAASSTGRLVCTFRGDITKLRVDAMVSSTNSIMTHSSGVHGKIQQCGGHRFLANVKELRDNLGQAGLVKGTSAMCNAAGDLRCKVVIMSNAPGLTQGHELENVIIFNKKAYPF